MEIQFSFVEGVQVIKLGGTLGEAEAAATRFKLEEKINQGRVKILFDISTYDVQNPQALSNLKTIILYSLTRNALTACSGVNSNLWPSIMDGLNTQLKLFISQPEALEYLKAQKVEPEKTDGKPKIKTELDIKSEALAELLKKYEVFQQNDDSDPLRVQFTADQFKIKPSREAMIVEKKAKIMIETLDTEIDTLKKNCDALSLQVKRFMLIRKQPLSAKEIDLKLKNLNFEIKEEEEALTKAEKQTIDMLTAISAIEEKFEILSENHQEELAVIQGKIKKTEDEHKKNLDRFAAQEKDELDLIAKLKQNAP